MTSEQAAKLALLKKKVGEKFLKNSNAYPGGPNAKHIHHIYFYGSLYVRKINEKREKLRLDLGIWVVQQAVEEP